MMAQSTENGKTTKAPRGVLDLDALTLDSPCIRFPSGTEIELRLLSTNEMADFFDEFSQRVANASVESMLSIVDMIPGIALDSDGAAPMLELLPATEPPKIFEWLREATKPVYHVDMPPDQQFMLGGQAFTVQPLLVSTVRAVYTAWREIHGDADIDDVGEDAPTAGEWMDLNIGLLAERINGVTADEILEWPYAQRKKLEAYLEEAWLPASQGGSKRPTSRRRRRKRS